MKTLLAIFCIFLVSAASAADSNTGQAAQTIEELGQRIAQSLIVADTNSLATLLPPYEAYFPVIVNTGHISADEDLHDYYNHVMDKLREEVQKFPSEFKKFSSFPADQIDGFQVDVQLQDYPNWSRITGTFTIKDAKFPIITAKCIFFSNAWYVMDFH